MLKEVDGRDLVLNNGTRITVPDGTRIKAKKNGVFELTAHAQGGAKSVTCELTIGATEQYVRFVLDHMANEIQPHRS